VFREVIRFIYSDNANITEDNVQSLMELSDQYLLPALTSYVRIVLLVLFFLANIPTPSGDCYLQVVRVLLGTKSMR
jgi:hypothetical protein